MACGCGTCAGCIGGALPGSSFSSGGCGPMRQKLTQRLAPRVDKLRQRLVSFGLRPYNVFLVWTHWSGLERGEGAETELRRIQLIPNPLVEDLSGVTLNPFTAGLLPVGSIRISQISMSLNEDNLTGKLIPGQAYFAGCALQTLGVPMAPDVLARTSGENIGTHSDSMVRDHIFEPNDFFYEVVEDVPNAQRKKYRLLSTPFRRPGKFDWTLMLERVSEDRARSGASQYGPDPEP